MLDITLVLFHPRLDELRDTLDSLAGIRAEFSKLRVLISGNNAEALAAVAGLTDAGLLDVCVFEHRYDNLGFATGHNRLVRDAFEGGASAVLILNPDVSIAPGALNDLRATTALVGGDHLFGPTLGRREVGAVAPDSFDSAGIGWSVGGRHFDIAQGEKWQVEPGRVDTVDGVTGACLFVPRRAYELILDRTGQFFDDAFLAYREDAELGIRARLVGVTSLLVHQDGFSHVRSVRGYQRGSTIADLLGVKNRYLIRWKLGGFRPGQRCVALARDVLVWAAVLTYERRSLPGLRQAFAIKKYEIYWGRYLKRAHSAYRDASPGSVP